MRRKTEELRSEIAGIRERLIGISVPGNSFENPASYSALGKLKSVEDRQRRLEVLLDLLLEELGYRVEEGLMLVRVVQKHKEEEASKERSN